MATPVGHTESLDEAGPPPILGAHAAIGRWLLDESGKPVTKPVLEKVVKRLAFFSGVYTDWKYGAASSMPSRRQVSLRQDFNGERFEARLDAVKTCFAANPPYDVLHFALHGNYNPGGTEDGLILVDMDSVRQKE